MNAVIDEAKEIGDFTNAEISDEYISRFGDPDDADIDDFDNDDIREEYERRFGGDEPEAPAGVDEIMDLIAEAARTSRHAKRAYELLYAEWPTTGRIEARWVLMAGRMGEAA